MQSNNIKGVWMPFEIMTNENLNDKEKIIYSLILFFSKTQGYCSITNKYLGSLVILSDTRVSKLISSLCKKKYIQVITNYQDSTKKMVNRIIKPLVKYDNPTYSKTTIDIVNNDNGTSQNCTTTMVNNNKNIKYNKYKNNKSNERNYSDKFLESLYINNY